MFTANTEVCDFRIHTFNNRNKSSHKSWTKFKSDSSGSTSSRVSALNGTLA
jgi:hypothetical protein